MSETHNHAALKIKAVEWLYLDAKCRYIATEVKIGKYIFDVVGCDGTKVYIIEAKQDRSDFLRDCNNPNEIRQTINEYRRLLKETSDIKKYKNLMQKEKEKSIKFCDDAVYRLSTFRYIIAPDGMINENEIPEKWGLINEKLQVLKRSSGHKIEGKYPIKVIMDICKKQTKNYLEKNLGVLFERVIEFPKIDLI